QGGVARPGAKGHRRPTTQTARVAPGSMRRTGFAAGLHPNRGGLPAGVRAGDTPQGTTVVAELSLTPDTAAPPPDADDPVETVRCNPSSGNLHPTEGYAVLPAVPGLPAGVYHYLSRDHLLERRCTLSDAESRRLAEALPPGAFLVGLSSVHWREAWKYGERAFRYCQHDVGHAVAAVRYAAAALGWSARLLNHLGDDEVATWLGCNRAADYAAVAPDDREHPDAL